jgi:hypothetical protein
MLELEDLRRGKNSVPQSARRAGMSGGRVCMWCATVRTVQDVDGYSRNSVAPHAMCSRESYCEQLEREPLGHLGMY